MITEAAYQNASALLNIEPAIIKTVAEVESHGSGFLTNGKCKILFEPHIFWKRLQARNINPTVIQKDNEDILYPTWGERPYGKNLAQWDRLARARKINVDAANESASWGKFQILGENYKAAGFNLIQNFVDAMCATEDAHLLAFINFVKSKGLVTALQNKDWAAFAKGYNGNGYKKNEYDVKLKEAYERFKQKSPM
jgi:hypothetical protein